MEPEEEEGVLDTLTAVALYDYLAHAPDELTIAKGEVVMVLEEYDDGWWLVGNDNDDAGVVPSNYLSPFTTQGNDQTVDSLRGIEHVDAETGASINFFFAVYLLPDLLPSKLIYVFRFGLVWFGLVWFGLVWFGLL